MNGKKLWVRYLTFAPSKFSTRAATCEKRNSAAIGRSRKVTHTRFNASHATFTRSRLCTVRSVSLTGALVTKVRVFASNTASQTWLLRLASGDRPAMKTKWLRMSEQVRVPSPRPVSKESPDEVL